MSYLIVIFPILILTIFFSLGNFLVFGKKICSYEKVVYGFGVVILLTNAFYFLFDLSLAKVLKIIFFFFLFTFVILIIQKKLVDLVKILFYSLPILFPLFFLDILYGEQFYIFRGNIYDQFSYLSTGMVLFDLNHSQVLELYKSKLYTDDYIINGIPQMYARSSTQLLIGILFNISSLSIAKVGYIFKIMVTLLSFFAFISFLKNYLIKSRYANLIAVCFIFSFFYFYNYEIDALSLLGFCPFFIIILKHSPNLIINLKNKNYTYLFLYTLVHALSFIIYPNGSAAVSPPIFFYLLFKIFKEKIKVCDFFYLIGFFLLFLLLVLPFYKSTFMYLFSEMNIGLTNKVDFWGYYGAFIFGKSNPIHNIDVVMHIKSLAHSGTSFYTIAKEIIKANLDSNNSFFLFNIIPSIFGFYHFTTSSNYSYLFNILLIIFLVSITLIVLKNLYYNFKIILISKNNLLVYFKFIFFYFVVFFIYLILNSLFWSAIKLFFIFSPIFFIVVSFSFKDKNIEKENILLPRYAILILLSLLPFYKYSEFNYGIGKIDSFPSILKAKDKTDINWEFDNNALSKCSDIAYKFNDRFKKVYISMTFNKLKKNNNLYNPVSQKCEVLFINKNFIVKKI
jgi:hypothetical protein